MFCNASVDPKAVAIFDNYYLVYTHMYIPHYDIEMDKMQVYNYLSANYLKIIKEITQKTAN